MTTLYHVCRDGWDGGPLESLVARLGEWSDEVCEAIEAAWPGNDAWTYYCQEGRHIHCHDTLDEAQEFAAEFGGQLLAIEADGLNVRIGDEYPHPVVCDAIPADRICVVE